MFCIQLMFNFIRPSIKCYEAKKNNTFEMLQSIYDISLLIFVEEKCNDLMIRAKSISTIRNDFTKALYKYFDENLLVKGTYKVSYRLLDDFDEIYNKITAVRMSLPCFLTNKCF